VRLHSALRLAWLFLVLAHRARLGCAEPQWRACRHSHPGHAPAI